LDVPLSDVSLQDVVESGVKLTPMMKQYLEIKNKYADCFLLFRMGDFYEVFFEDARAAARILNIALTHRGKLGDFKIPMAGIPHHSAAAYIDRLTNQGLKVAICEQVSEPGAAPGIVQRAVTQIVSPGIPYDVEKLDRRERHYIGSAYYDKNIFHMIFIDFTTGDFFGHLAHTIEDLQKKYLLYRPKEWISYLGQWDEFPSFLKLAKEDDLLMTNLSQEYFSSKLALKLNQKYLAKFIPQYESDKVINKRPNLLIPISAIAYYLHSTQEELELCHIKPFKLINDSDFLNVSLGTLQGLEIFPRQKERYLDSLLGFCDKTKTSMGSRKIREIFSKPLLNAAKILERQNIILGLMKNTQSLEELRSNLDSVRDIDRLLSKLSTKKVIGGDLLSLAFAVRNILAVEKILTEQKIPFKKSLSENETNSILKISDEIEKTINSDIGASLEKGNLILDGVHSERDKLYALRFSSDKELEKLEEKYKKQSGISKLRVKSNNVAGFFIEVSKSHTKNVPKHFERRQTLVNAERYVTEELLLLEKKVLTAQARLEKVEREIFQDLCQKTASISSELSILSDFYAYLDVYAGLAWLAYQEDFKLPKIHANKKIFRVKGMWHPLIKKNLKNEFVPHDLILDEKVFLGLITGPNMAGKTTVMREMAIIQLLAQVGSLVPAHEAELGLCDHLFSRLGASDDILRGQSTFMVEMMETSEILRHASNKSMIILDEVGRGTSTYDGLSIAWSLVEYLVHKVKALCLFATHYHELIALADAEAEIKNLTVETLNHFGEIKFLYKLIESSASQSFGLYVAELSGLPRELIERSKVLLRELESEGQGTAPAKADQGTQLSFFEDNLEEYKAYKLELHKLKKEIAAIDINGMTPLEALNKLSRLRSEINYH
jgi:DNA mismatch repair protein MutS